MSFTSYTDEKIKKLDWIDMGLTKMACFAFGVILVKLIPALTGISVWYIIAVWIILAIRPLYKFFK